MERVIGVDLRTRLAPARASVAAGGQQVLVRLVPRRVGAEHFAGRSIDRGGRTDQTDWGGAAARTCDHLLPAVEVLLVRSALRQRHELSWQVDLVAAHHAASCWRWAARSSASRTPKIALTRC